MQIASKKDIPETLIVEIEKLSNLGFGIARVEGYVIFVEGACPGDKVKIRVGKKNKNFANAKVIAHTHTHTHTHTQEWDSTTRRE